MKNSFAFKRSPGNHRGVTYVLLFWSLFLLFIVGAFFQERIALFSDHPTTAMNTVEFYLSFACILVCVVAYLILVHRNFRIGIAWGWLILFLILFAGNAVGLFTFDTFVSGSGVYRGEEFMNEHTFTIAERMEYLCCFFVACIFFYIFFAIMPKTFHNIRRFHFVWYMAVIIVLAMIVYSLIAEWPLYQQSFTPGQKWVIVECRSFTNNPNTFAYAIMMGIGSLMLLHNRRSHWYWIAVMLLLGLYQVLLGSGSGAIGSWVMIVVYLVYRFRMTLWSYTGRNVLFGLLFVGSFLAVLICVFAQVGGEGSFFYRLGAVLKRDHFSETSGALRLVTWQRIFDSLNTPLKLIFGVGDTQAYYYLGVIDIPAHISLIAYAHNGFFHQLLSGGLLRLGIYLFLIVRFVYLCFQGFKDKHHICMAALIIMVGLLVRSFLETTSFLSMESSAACMQLLVILPVEVVAFLKKHPEVEGYEQTAIDDLVKPKRKYKITPLRMAKLCFLFLTPVAAIAVSSVPLLTGPRDIGYYVLWGVAFFLMPFTYYCLGHHADHDDRGIFSFLVTLGFLLSLGLGIALESLLPLSGYIGAGGVAVIALIAFLYHARSVFSFRENLFLHAYLPHLLVAGVIVAAGCTLYLVPPEFVSVYNPIMTIVGCVALYVCFLTTGYGQKLSFPWGERWQAFDCHRTAMGIVKEMDLNHRQEEYLYKGINRTPPPRQDHRISI